MNVGSVVGLERREKVNDQDVRVPAGTATILAIGLFTRYVSYHEGDVIKQAGFIYEPGNKHHLKMHGVAPDFALWLVSPDHRDQPQDGDNDQQNSTEHGVSG